MVKTVARIIRLTDTRDDVSYWRSQSYAKRLEALEQIRSEYIGWKYGAEQGLQRVYRVTKLE